MAGGTRGGSASLPYLMGLNMAFPKSWNLRTSFRCTPLGFTTGGGRGTLAASKASRLRALSGERAPPLLPAAAPALLFALPLPCAADISLQRFSSAISHVVLGTFPPQ